MSIIRLSKQYPASLAPPSHSLIPLLFLFLDRNPRPRDRPAQQVLTPLLSVGFRGFFPVADTPDTVGRGSLFIRNLTASDSVWADIEGRLRDEGGLTSTSSRS